MNHLKGFLEGNMWERRSGALVHEEKKWKLLLLLLWLRLVFGWFLAALSSREFQGFSVADHE
jgi:hypothetical protein